MTIRTIALAVCVPALVASMATAQECLPVLRQDRTAAMTDAMVREIERLGLQSPNRDSVRMGREVVADPNGSLFVELAGAKTGVSGSRYVALAGSDSLCSLEARGISFGVRADTASVTEWNAGVARVAARLRLADASAARAVALAAIVYATAWGWDTISTSIHHEADGWSVGGVVSSEGRSRRFSVRLSDHAAIIDLFLQYPPTEPSR